MCTTIHVRDILSLCCILKAPGQKASLSGPAQPSVTPAAAAKQNSPSREALQMSEGYRFITVSGWCLFRLCLLNVSGFRDPKKPEKWRIITDAGLMKISSFPYFFHGDYCVSQVSRINSSSGRFRILFSR